jgi:phosphatidylinositol alpha-mannosyltransferase
VKIALTTHNYWPYFRRGSSRHIHNLASYLLKKGHQVHIITSKPGGFKFIDQGNLRITYHPYLYHPLLLRYRVERFHGFIYSTLRSLMAERYDVTYCMFHTDGFAASLMKRNRFILNVSTVPFRQYWENRRLDEWMFARAAHTAVKCVMPSQFANQCMKEDYDTTGDVIPMSVDLEKFLSNAKKPTDQESILFVSAAYDGRKGVLLLLEAFERLKREIPGAVLRIASQMTPGDELLLKRSIPHSIRSAVEIMGPGRVEDLPALYASSSITVLPSLNEVFGMVLIESLACGTPVVGSRSGAIPEIISSPDIGVLFDPMEVTGRPTNAQGLCEAMLQGLALAKMEKTASNCRQHAEPYDLERVGKAFEQLFISVC